MVAIIICDTTHKMKAQLKYGLNGKYQLKRILIYFEFVSLLTLILRKVLTKF